MSNLSNTLTLKSWDKLTMSNLSNTLKSWDKLCTPKDKGGLGFKKAKDSNSALRAKLACG